MFAQMLLWRYASSPGASARRVVYRFGENVSTHADFATAYAARRGFLRQIQTG